MDGYWYAKLAIVGVGGPDIIFSSSSDNNWQFKKSRYKVQSHIFSQECIQLTKEAGHKPFYISTSFISFRK